MTDKAPAHLREETRQWYIAIAAEYVLEAHHLRLLQLAAECWDRIQQARERIEVDGAYQRTPEGAIRAHPAVGVERDGRIAFARLLRELCLDDAPPPDVRLPRAAGGRR